MNNRGLAAIVVIALLIMAGAVVYHIYDAPALERFNLRIHVLNTTSIGHLSIGSYAYNVYSLYFNLTLNGYRNYTVTFPQYIEYGGVENTTATIYMSGNITMTVPYVLKGIYPPGRIFI